MRNIYILTVEKNYVDFQCLICIVLILKTITYLYCYILQSQLYFITWCSHSDIKEKSLNLETK